jgi:hypothetical protein
MTALVLMTVFHFSFFLNAKRNPKFANGGIVIYHLYFPTMFNEVVKMKIAKGGSHHVW